jgi:hypothetical protein
LTVSGLCGTSTSAAKALVLHRPPHQVPSSRKARLSRIQYTLTPRGSQSHWRIEVSRRSPGNDATHQWEYPAEAHALGGLAFYLIYAETLDRVFVAGLRAVRLMLFPVEEAQHFTDMIEVVKDENGWWDWLEALEEAGVLALPPRP